MKQVKIKLLSLAILAMPFLIGCSDDNENNSARKTAVELLESGEMNGLLTEDYTLTLPQYKLTGSFRVSEGVSLSIPAGTKIVADAGGTDVYLAVLMGGKIFINGTESKPVVMSSNAAEPGDWGGLTICGKAYTSAGENAVAEVGGFIYGGSIDDDNSGVIENLVIKGTGAQINAESQYNGVSFYAVGSGTIVKNIAVINGSDDGVEFFGGTVSAENLFLKNNEDDAIDWTEAWSGTVKNAYVEHSVAGFSTVVEADKENNHAKLINLTAISTVGGTALQFKKESGASITALYLEGYDYDLDMKDNGQLSNVKINNADADAELVDGETTKYVLKSGKDANKVDPSSWLWIETEL